MGLAFSSDGVGTQVQTSEIQDGAVTLGKMATATQGSIITYDSFGTPTELAVSTANQVLTSNGTGNDLLWSEVGQSIMFADQEYTTNGTADNYMRPETFTSASGMFHVTESGASTNDAAITRFCPIQIELNSTNIFTTTWVHAVDSIGSTVEWFAGLDNGTFTGSGTEAISFVHDSGVTTIVARTTSGGTSTSSSDIATHFNTAGTEVQTLSIRASTASCSFSVDGTSRATSSTNIPSAKLAFAVTMRNTGAGGANKTWTGSARIGLI